MCQNLSLAHGSMSLSPVTMFSASDDDRIKQTNNLLGAESEHACASYPITQSTIIAVFIPRRVNTTHEGQLHIIFSKRLSGLINNFAKQVPVQFK